MEDQAREFLNTLFEEVETPANILIWTLPDKISRWFEASKTDEAAVHIEKFMDENDVYVGAGLAPALKGGTKARCKADEVIGITSLWADIDIADEVHKKSNLPPTIEDAIEFLYDLGPKPTMVVHSGHGLQAWWCFKEPLMFENDDERQAAAHMAAKWNHTIKHHAGTRGWTVDMTHDLSRVMRVPGTMNRKRKPVPVRIIETHDIRYDIDDFELYLVDVEIAEYIDSAKTKFEVNQAAVPCFEKFQILERIEPRFKQSWERTRKDMGADDSASSYDMSLATLAANAGWTDQEIVDLMTAHRRKHGDLGNKHSWPDYFDRTIKRARMAVKQQTARNRVADLAVDINVAESSAQGLQDRKTAIFKAITDTFGINIVRIIKYLSSPPQYRLVTHKGSIMLGEVKHLIHQGYLREKIAAAADHYLPPINAKQWPGYAQLLLEVCDHQEVGEETTERGALSLWLDQYLTDYAPADEIGNDVILAQAPYIKDSSIYIFGTGFRDWLNRRMGEKVASKTLGAMLRHYGAALERINIEIGGRMTSRSVWRLGGDEN